MHQAGHRRVVVLAERIVGFARACAGTRRRPGCGCGAAARPDRPAHEQARVIGRDADRQRALVPRAPPRARRRERRKMRSRRRGRGCGGAAASASRSILAAARRGSGGGGTTRALGAGRKVFAPPGAPEGGAARLGRPCGGATVRSRILAPARARHGRVRTRRNVVPPGVEIEHSSLPVPTTRRHAAGPRNRRSERAYSAVLPARKTERATMYDLLLGWRNGILKIGSEVQSKLRKKVRAARAPARERTPAAEIARKSSPRKTLSVSIIRLASAGAGEAWAPATPTHSRVAVAFALRVATGAARPTCDFPTTTVRRARPPPRAAPARRGAAPGRSAAAPRGTRDAGLMGDTDDGRAGSRWASSR